MEITQISDTSNTKTKNAYYNKKNHCNNIYVIVIVDMSCYNKIWDNKFMQWKILL